MRRVSRIFFSVLPFLICASLLYAALFIKPSVSGASIKPAPIERRDKFFGIEVPAKGSVWAAGTNGKVILSQDGGKNWTVQVSPVKQHLQDIAAWDEQRAVAVGNEGVVILTRDGGKTWQEVKAPRSEVANKLIKVIVVPGGQAWTVGAMGAVLYSKDFGSTWERRIKEEDVAWNGITFVDAKVAWVVGEFGRMLRTTDGGVTWKPRDSPTKRSLNAVAFRDAMHGVAVGLEGTVLKTDNGGVSWSQVQSVTGEHLFDVVWDGTAWISIGTKGTVLRGEKNGTIWRYSRLSEYDLSWHTKGIRKFGALYMAGSTIGVLRDGKWHQFKAT